MAPPRMWWFRAPCDWPDDPVLRAITHADRWLYVTLHTIARVSPEPGLVLLSTGRVPTMGQLADKAGPGLTETDVAEALRRMVGDGLLEVVAHGDGDELTETWRIERWDREQPKGEKSSTARVRAFRDRKAKDAAANGQGELPADTGPDPDGAPAGHAQRVVDVARLLGRRDTARQMATTGHGVKNPVAYAAQCARTRHEDPNLDRYVFFHPDLTVHELADGYDTATVPPPALRLIVNDEPPSPPVDALTLDENAAHARALRAGRRTGATT
jgi:hypothetical protein